MRFGQENSFMRSKMYLAVCILGLSLGFTTPARASGAKEPAAIAVDVLIGRPACLVATIVGGAVFVVSLPVAATTGEIDAVADALVMGPVRATFVRPLGDFGSMEYYATKKATKRAVRSPKQETETGRSVR